MLTQGFAGPGLAVFAMCWPCCAVPSCRVQRVHHRHHQHQNTLLPLQHCPTNHPPPCPARAQRPAPPPAGTALHSSRCAHALAHRCGQLPVTVRRLAPGVEGKLHSPAHMDDMPAYGPSRSRGPRSAERDIILGAAYLAFAPAEPDRVGACPAGCRRTGTRRPAIYPGTRVRAALAGSRVPNYHASRHPTAGQFLRHFFAPGRLHVLPRPSLRRPWRPPERGGLALQRAEAHRLMAHLWATRPPAATATAMLLPRTPPLACLALLLAHHLASAQLANPPPSPPPADAPSPRSPLLFLGLVLVFVIVVYTVASLSFLVLGESDGLVVTPCLPGLIAARQACGKPTGPPTCRLSSRRLWRRLPVARSQLVLLQHHALRHARWLRELLSLSRQHRVRGAVGGAAGRGGHHAQPGPGRRLPLPGAGAPGRRGIPAQPLPPLRQPGRGRVGPAGAPAPRPPPAAPAALQPRPPPAAPAAL
jgi:hypothetical protein